MYKSYLEGILSRSVPGHSSSLRFSHSCTRLIPGRPGHKTGTCRPNRQLTLQELSRHNREKDNGKDNQLILSFEQMERSCYPKSLSVNTKTSPPQSPLNFALDQEIDLSGLRLKGWKIIKQLFSVTNSHNKIMFPYHPPEGENLRPNYFRGPQRTEVCKCLTKHQ